MILALHKFHRLTDRLHQVNRLSTNTTTKALGKCGKPKFGSDSVFKKPAVQKFDIRSDGFPIETACNPQFK